MCGIQCTHPDGFNHVGLHRSYHQPSGLNGISFIGTNELCAQSCVSAALANHCILLDRGTPNEKSIPYRAFNTHYKDWENPPYEGESVPDPLQVRELIFANKQNLLVNMYQTCKKCTAIPPEYFRKEEDLKKMLKLTRRTV